MVNIITGIYAVRNMTNDKVYIGSSKNIENRWKYNHLPMLRHGNHFNRHLQAAWNKYGESNFVLEVLEKCTQSELLLKEGEYIEKLKSWDRTFGYNLNRIIEGITVYETETKKLMSDSAKRSKDFWQKGINRKILELYATNMSKNGIARKLSINREAVYTCLQNNGLHVSCGEGTVVKLTSQVKEQVLEMREEGRSWDEIARDTGVSKTQMDRSMKIRDGGYGGGKVKRSTYVTLTPEKEKRAIELRNQGKSWKNIGEELGVSRQVFYWHGLASEQKNMVRKKVTPEAVSQAKFLKQQGLTCPEIGRKLDYSTETFRRYL